MKKLKINVTSGINTIIGLILYLIAPFLIGAFLNKRI